MFGDRSKWRRVEATATVLYGNYAGSSTWAKMRAALALRPCAPLPQAYSRPDSAPTGPVWILFTGRTTGKGGYGLTILDDFPRGQPSRRDGQTAFDRAMRKKPASHHLQLRCEHLQKYATGYAMVKCGAPYSPNWPGASERMCPYCFEVMRGKPYHRSRCWPGNMVSHLLVGHAGGGAVGKRNADDAPNKRHTRAPKAVLSESDLNEIKDGLTDQLKSALVTDDSNAWDEVEDEQEFDE
jgi:hypothetical protein